MEVVRSLDQPHHLCFFYAKYSQVHQCILYDIKFDVKSTKVYETRHADHKCTFCQHLQRETFHYMLSFCIVGVSHCCHITLWIVPVEYLTWKEQRTRTLCTHTAVSLAEAGLLITPQQCCSSTDRCNAWAAHTDSG